MQNIVTLTAYISHGSV